MKQQESILQTKFELFMNRIKDKYYSKDKITKNEFRENLGKFFLSFNYMNTIIKIEDRNIALLGLLAKQLYLALAENDGSKQEIKSALENLKIEKHKIIAVDKIEYEEAKRGKLHKVKEREISKLTIHI